MPKAKEKTKSKIRSSKRNKINEPDDLVHIAPKIKRKKANIELDDSISKSKQLARKQNKTACQSRVKTKNNEHRICGNGKPMPSLLELEKMYEDSDNEEEKQVKKTDECHEYNPPVDTITIDDDISVSPTKIIQITSKVVDLIQDLAEKIIDDNGPSLPVIPQKKTTKSGIPYIVGCKERPQVIKKSKANFCKGDNNYGVDYKNATTDEDLKDTNNGTSYPKFTKSIFNAQSDEIAARLLCEEANASDDSDSNKTVVYELNTISPQNGKTRAFSPLPSTSKDNETFLKNDKLFNESLSNDSMQSDVEVIEIPCETIIIDDDVSNINDTIKSSEIEDCEIIKKQERSLICSPILVEDYYNNLDINDSYDRDVAEIINVDDVIAENEAIIKKYKMMSNIDSVINVEPVLDNKFGLNNKSNVQQTKKIIEQIVTNFFENKTNHDTSALLETSPEIQKNANQVKQWVSTLKYPQPIIIDTISLDESTNTSNNDISIINSPRIPPRMNRKIYRQMSNTPFSNVFHVTNPPGRQRGKNKSRKIILAQNRESSLSQHSARANHDLSYPVQVTYQNENISQQHRPQSRHDESCSVSKNTQFNHCNTPMSNTSPQISSVTPNSFRSLGDCPICMDNLSSKAIASTKCGHVFCMDCIKAVIKTNKKCPTCRKGLVRASDYHPLFL